MDNASRCRLARINAQACQARRIRECEHRCPCGEKSYEECGCPVHHGYVVTVSHALSSGQVIEAFMRGREHGVETLVAEPVVLDYGPSRPTTKDPT